MFNLFNELIDIINGWNTISNVVLNESEVKKKKKTENKVIIVTNINYIIYDYFSIFSVHVSSYLRRFSSIVPFYRCNLQSASIKTSTTYIEKFKLSNTFTEYILFLDLQTLLRESKNKLILTKDNNSKEQLQKLDIDNKMKNIWKKSKMGKTRNVFIQ